MGDGATAIIVIGAITRRFGNDNALRGYVSSSRMPA
jgi:hypothetical protein